MENKEFPFNFQRTLDSLPHLPVPQKHSNSLITLTSPQSCSIIPKCPVLYFLLLPKHLILSTKLETAKVKVIKRNNL